MKVLKQIFRLPLLPIQILLFMWIVSENWDKVDFHWRMKADLNNCLKELWNWSEEMIERSLSAVSINIFCATIWILLIYSLTL